MALYHIQQKTAGPRRFPANQTTLSISWLQGRVEAVAVHKGELAGTWTCPDPVDDLERFGAVVKTAAQKTGYNGSTVSMVLSHPRLVHQLIETPPTRGANALEQAIERQIERMKVFDGSAAWSFEAAGESRNTQNTLLHLLPKQVVEAFVKGTERAGLHLVSVLPPTSVLRQQLGHLGLSGNEVALIVGQNGDLLTLIVGRRDGSILLGRLLDPSRLSGSGGLALELNRTLLFVNQQFGVPVSTVWWYGPAAAERVAELGPQLPVAIKASPDNPRPCYWAEENARLLDQKGPNLVSTEQQNAPKREALLRLSTVITLGLLILSTTTFTAMTYFTTREQTNIKKLEQQVAVLQAQHRELQSTHTSLARQEATVKALLDGRLAPVPAWFLAYLGQEVPQELRLTDVLVRRENDLWRIRVGGQPQPSLATTNKPPGGSTSTNAVATLAERFRTGPFRMRLTETNNFAAAPPALPNAKPGSGGPLNGLTSWSTRRPNLPNGTAPAMSPQRDRFVLEGWSK